MPSRVELADHLADALDQRRVDPAGRLVEQDQLRVEHEHLGQLDELLLAVGERPRLLVAERAHADELEQLLGARGLRAADRVRVELAPARTTRSGATTFSSTVISRNSRVIWKVRPMPRCARSHGGSRSIAPAVEDRPRRRPRRIVPPIRLNSGRLARAVRPDQRRDRALRHDERAAVDRRQAAEALAQARAPRAACRPLRVRRPGGRARSRQLQPRAPTRPALPARAARLEPSADGRDDPAAAGRCTTSAIRPPKISSRALPPPSVVVGDLVERLDDERAEHRPPQRRPAAEQHGQHDLDAEQDVEHADAGR